MPLTALGAIALAIQGIASSTPLLVEKSNTLDKLIQDSGRAVKVSNLAYRVPSRTALPANYAKVNLDSNTVGLPAGGSSEYLQGTISPIASAVPIEWTKLAELVDKPETAILNVVSKEMGYAMDRLKQARDMNLASGDGTGILATVTGVAGNVLTLDSTSFGARLLVKNQPVLAFNGSALLPSGNAYGNSITIQQVYSQLGQNQTVQVDTVPAGLGVGSVLRVDGVENGAPVFTNGILSYLSNSQTGTTMNVNRAQNNWIVANGYDAQLGTPTIPMLRLMLDQIINALGEEALTPGSLVIHTSLGQVANYESLGEQFAVIPFSDGKGGDLDPFFRGKKSVDGHAIVKNIHAHASRWDALALKSWGKVVYDKGTFWYSVDGTTVFPVQAANGSPTTAARSFLIDPINYYVDNFKAQSSIYNAASANGY